MHLRFIRCYSCLDAGHDPKVCFCVH
jgi:hypothetical protein